MAGNIGPIKLLLIGLAIAVIAILMSMTKARRSRRQRMASDKQQPR